MNSYETIMILSSKVEDEEREKTINKFKELIEQNGKFLNMENWGKRKLAYPIKKQNEGYYVLINFRSNADFIDEFNRQYNIDDVVIKHIIVKKD